MSYRVETVPRFNRQARRFFRGHPELRDRFGQMISELATDPFQPHLRLHPLTGKYAGQHAASLTYEYRVVLILRVSEQRITLLAIGDHDEVYG